MFLAQKLVLLVQKLVFPAQKHKLLGRRETFNCKSHRNRLSSEGKMK